VDNTNANYRTHQDVQKFRGDSRDRWPAHTGTLILRFSLVLILDTHFHQLFLDIAGINRRRGTTRFRSASTQSSQELTQLTETIAQRVGR